MPARRSSVQGNFALRRTLRNIHTNLENEIKPAMQLAADHLLAVMRENVPKDTGAGAAALSAFVSKSGLDAQVGLRGKKANRRFYYLRHIEYGTKGYSGGKRTSGRNRRKTNKTDGSHWFGNSPDIPARPAHPWLRPAYDTTREFIIASLSQAVSNTLKRASEELGDG